MRLARNTHKVLHRRRGREAHSVEAAGLDHVARLRRRRGGAHGAVGDHVVDLPALFPQAVHQHVGAEVRTGQQHARDRVDVLDVFRERLRQASRVLLRAVRHKLGLHAAGDQRAGGLLPHRAQVYAGERAGVQAQLLKLRPHRVDGVDRSEQDPLVAALHDALDRAVHLRGVARRFQRDRGHGLRNRAVLRQAGVHRPRLGLRTRHEHAPAVQRSVFPPRVFRAVVRRGAEGDHQRPLQLGVELPHGAQRRVERALQAGSAARGHRHRRGRLEAPLRELLHHIRQVLLVRLQHQRLWGGGELVPVHVAVVQVGFRVGRAQRDTGERRHRRRQRHPRHHLELYALGGHRGDLLHHGIARQGVAGDQADHVAVASLAALHNVRGFLQCELQLLDDHSAIQPNLLQLRSSRVLGAGRLTPRAGRLRLGAHLLVALVRRVHLGFRHWQRRRDDASDPR